MLVTWEQLKLDIRMFLIIISAFHIDCAEEIEHNEMCIYFVTAREAIILIIKKSVDGECTRQGKWNWPS